MKIKLTKILTAVLLAAAMTAVLASCAQTENAEGPGGTEGEYIDVFTGNLFSGVVTAAAEVNIEKKNDTEIAEIRVKEGDEVKEGDVLFAYDVERLYLDMERAVLEVEQLKNKISLLNDNKAQLERDKAGASASQQLNYSLEIKEIEAEILESDYNMQIKQKEAENLWNTVYDAEVKSPVSGTVLSINENGGTDMYGTPLPFMVISETGNLQVKGYINETNMGSIMEGMPVVIKSRVDDRTWNGMITKIDMEAPASNMDAMIYGEVSDTASSSKYPFYIELENTEGLMNGRHVYIEIPEMEMTDMGMSEIPELDEGVNLMPENDEEINMMPAIGEEQAE